MRVGCYKGGMDRRNFLASSSAAGLAAGAATAAENEGAANQIFEVRCYKLRVLEGQPVRQAHRILGVGALAHDGAPGDRAGVFRVTLGEFTPRVYTLTAYDSLADMAEKMSAMRDDKAWSKAENEFGSHDEAPFDRVESWLLRAFDGMKAIKVPEIPDKPRAFDLRIYEQETLRDTQEKMRMFNEEEIQIFRDCGVHPVFFGETIVGSHMPSLIYMSHYADMDARAKAWSTFGQSEGWNRIKNRPGWGNADIVSTVSNIHLAGLPFSPIR